MKTINISSEQRKKPKSNTEEKMSSYTHRKDDR